MFPAQKHMYQMQGRKEKVGMYVLAMEYGQLQYGRITYFYPSYKINPTMVQLSFFDKNTGMFTQQVYVQTYEECDYIFEKLKEIVLRISQYDTSADNWSIYQAKLTNNDMDCCQGKTDEQLIEYLNDDPRFKSFFINSHYYYSTADLGAALFQYISYRMIKMKQSLQAEQEVERDQQKQYMSVEEVVRALKDYAAVKEKELRGADLKDYYAKQKEVCFLKNLAENVQKM